MGRKKKTSEEVSPEEKRSVGRPTEYRAEYCGKLIEHMKEGGSFEGFGGLIGHAKQTLYNWTKEFPEFMDAKEKGETASLLWWENIGRNNLIMEEGVKFNSTVWNKNMQNRFGWREKTDNAHELKLSPHQILLNLIEAKETEKEKKAGDELPKLP